MDLTYDFIKKYTSSILVDWIQVGTGCGLLILGSFLKIPFYPISFTMQTCALFTLAFTLTPRKVVFSIGLYLGLATLGVPVFGGHANSLWLIGKSGGYLMAFPLAAYLAAKLHQKKAPLTGLVLGHLILYFFGFLGVLPWVDVSTAFIRGVLLFLPSDFLKGVIVYSGLSIYHGVVNEQSL